MIIGTGIDATDIGRIAAAIDRYGDRFERRDGNWLIAYRVVAQEWRRVDAIPVGRVRGGGPGKWGTRDGNDAID